jgi:hypothetical protein
MSDPQQQGIARVRGPEASKVFGTAFLISPRHVMTCAHVVNAATGARWDALERPTAPLRVEFPFAANMVASAAIVAEWRPPCDNRAADIAVLQLNKPVDLPYYRTATAQPQAGQLFWTKGFPAGQDNGMEAQGKLGTRIEFGRMLAQGRGQEGFFIEGGFSGAPLLDPSTDVVLGMAVEATRDGTRRTAFVVPADQLELAWPPLARPYKGLLLTIRADYVGRALELGELADALADADVKLGPMNVAEIRQAIEAPARVLEVELQPGLADELARAVGARPDALPLLEFALADLWANQQDRKLKRPIMDEKDRSTTIDTMTAALERHAEAIYLDLCRLFDETAVRKVIMDMIRLADPNRGGEDTRRVRLRHEFTEREWSLIEQLSGQDRQARLVTIGANEIDGEATAEIVHEALISGWKRLHSWLAEDRAFRLWLQKTEEFAEVWRQEKDNANLLLSGKRLADAQDWWARKSPEDFGAVRDFVTQSLKKHSLGRLQKLRDERKAVDRQDNDLAGGRRMVLVGVTIFTMTLLFAGVFLLIGLKRAQ